MARDMNNSSSARLTEFTEAINFNICLRGVSNNNVPDSATRTVANLLRPDNKPISPKNSCAPSSTRA